MIKESTRAAVDQLIGRYPALEACREDLIKAVELICASYRQGHKLMVCGNGGSAADADHICGELLKGFLLKRPVSEDAIKEFESGFGAEGVEIAGKLQGGLRAVSLLSHSAFLSAFANDVDPDLMFAQQLWALGRSGDILLAMSTGGNASNVRKALMTARVKGIKSVLLTGNRHGCCEEYADCVVAVPEKETFKIQELHLPVYHAFCAALEERFFGSRGE